MFFSHPELYFRTLLHALLPYIILSNQAVCPQASKQVISLTKCIGLTARVFKLYRLNFTQHDCMDTNENRA